MFNSNTVKSALITLIGWRKSNDPTATNNPMGDLLTASSGQYYNDQHPLLTTKNLKAIADSFDAYTYSAYSAGTTYNKGDIVTSSGNYFVSEVNANTGNAVNLTAYWRQTNPYNEWLRNKTLAASIETVNDWLGLKFKKGTAANLLKRSQVLDAPGTKSETVGDTARYVCWSIVPTPHLDKVVTIDRISIQMENSESTVISLYKNGAATAIDTLTITGDGTSDVIWAECGWELERGNFYYIAIDRNSIDAVPINALAGMSLQAIPGNRFPGVLPYAEVGAFEHAGPGESGWDDVNDILTNQNNYGYNLQLSVKCDYTNLIVDQKNLFLNAIAKRVAMSMLRELAYNPSAKINREAGNIDLKTILYEIDGDSQGRKSGIGLQYEQALNNITFDTRTLSRVCLPCSGNKIHIGSV
jgi:hypothetical protein